MRRNNLRMIAVLLTILFCCTGCWDSIDIDRLAIIMASGLDYTQSEDTAKPKVVITAQIARASDLGTAGGGGSPSAQTGSTDAFVVQQAEGDDVFQAVQALQRNLSRRLFLGHRRIAIYGEDAARKGISTALDEVIRNPSSRLRSYLMVAYHSRAEEILKQPAALDRLPADALYSKAQGSPFAEVDTKTVAERVLSKDEDPFIIGVQSTTGVPNEQGESTKSFNIDNVALFQGDRLVGWLDRPKMIQAFGWLAGHVKQDELSVPIQGGNSVGLQLLRMESQIKVDARGGQPKIQLLLRGDFDVRQSEIPLNLNQPEVVQLVRTAVEKQIQSEVKAVVTVLQKQYRVDPLGIMHKIHTSNLRVWRGMQRDWRSAYEEVSIQVPTPSVRIKDTGLVGKGLASPSSTS